MYSEGKVLGADSPAQALRKSPQSPSISPDSRAAEALERLAGLASYASNTLDRLESRLQPIVEQSDPRVPGTTQAAADNRPPLFSAMHDEMDHLERVINLMNSLCDRISL